LTRFVDMSVLRVADEKILRLGASKKSISVLGYTLPQSVNGGTLATSQGEISREAKP